MSIGQSPSEPYAAKEVAEEAATEAASEAVSKAFRTASFTVSIGASGQQFDAWPNQPLLISAEQGGIDWPSSCRNGTCRTCIGQLVVGEVRYQIDWPGVSAEELAQGCVLPCVAYPCSDLVIGPIIP